MITSVAQIRVRLALARLRAAVGNIPPYRGYFETRCNHG
jgi:hypothetical protein